MRKFRLKKSKHKLRVFSCFTGVGGFELGLPKKKFEVIGFSEIDKYCDYVLTRNFPWIRNYGDITKLQGLPDFDLLVGGFPCQDASISGKRSGFKGTETSLFYHLVKILKEKRPRYFLYENVPGILNVNRGWDFARIQIALAEAGYDCRWEVLNARELGVPQNRERVFFVGYNRELCGREILLKGRKDITLDLKNRSQKIESDNENQKEFVVNNRGNLESRDISNAIDSNYYKGIDSNYYKGIDNHGQRTLVAYSSSGREKHIDHRANINTVANTLNTSSGCFSKDSQNVILDEEMRLRRLTPTECEALMSWPRGWTEYGIGPNNKTIKISNTQRYKMCGSGVVSTCVEYIVKKYIL